MLLRLPIIYLIIDKLFSKVAKFPIIVAVISFTQLLKVSKNFETFENLSEMVNAHRLLPT